MGAQAQDVSHYTRHRVRRVGDLWHERPDADDYPQFKLVSGKAHFQQTKQLFDVAFSMYYVLFTVLALPSLIALLNTLAIGVIERTREIGMLRAIGATRPQVRRMVIAEALLLAAIGTAFGLLGGLYLSYVMVLGMVCSFRWRILSRWASRPVTP